MSEAQAPADAADSGGRRSGRAWWRGSDSLRFAALADEVRRRGNLRQATTLCARGLACHPHYATGRVVMGDIFRDQSMDEQAEREWREALRLDPMHPRAQLRLGELYLRRGDIPRALAALEAALLAHPRFPEAEALLARARRAQPPADPPFRVGQRRSWRAGAMPAWLPAARFRDLIAAACGCPSVQSALLLDSEGAVLAASDGAAERMHQVADLLREARRMIARLGAGGLGALLLRAEEASLRCIALESLTLVVIVRPEAALETVDFQIEEAIARLQVSPAPGKRGG